ncbi:MAG: sodium-coupled permease, partial [Verrucomicrobiae bacterium]|nr:sodium-coupled permease [Verrucomicrobiae bacterium]
SLFASLLSTITYLSIPGEVFGKGPGFLANYLAYPFIFLIVAFVLLPFYMRQQVTSAYELLEERLGLSIRLLGASMFLLLRLVWMTLLISLTAKAIVTMIVPASVESPDLWIQERLPWFVAGIGLVSVTYAAMGGMRAVVVTDLIQTLLLYGGAVLVIATISIRMGGFSWFPTEWAPTWDTQPVFSTDPSTRVTLVGSFLMVLIWTVATAGGDQVSVQRFMSTTDLKAARRAVATQLSLSVLVGLTLALAGFAMLGYFHTNPDQLPDGLSGKAQADKIFPHFIAFHLPPVVSGLVVSGLFAAAMSSIDSGVNSITAVISRDFIDRFRKQPISEKHHVWVARIIAASIGIVVVLGSAFVEKVPGNITEVTTKTVNLLTVPIFCLFFFALFVRNSKPAAVWVATIIGVSMTATVAFSGPLVLWLHDTWQIDPATFGTELVTKTNEVTGEVTRSVPDPISFQWIQLTALSVTIGVGCLLNFLLPDRNSKNPPTAP